MTLDRDAARDGSEYAARLVDDVADAGAVHGLDELFRRHVDGGFGPLKRFVAALANEASPRDITCHIDAFAYAFIARAKNFDLLLPEGSPQVGGFRLGYERKWRDRIEELEDFERLGENPSSDTDRSHYVKLRPTVARRSARDERRALAVLLYSGPSTAVELRDELGLNESLALRVLAVLVGAGVVERRDSAFALRTETLPVVLFSLRETMGVDPMAMLD